MSKLCNPRSSSSPPSTSLKSDHSRSVSSSSPSLSHASYTQGTEHSSHPQESSDTTSSHFYYYSRGYRWREKVKKGDVISINRSTALDCLAFNTINENIIASMKAAAKESFRNPSQSRETEWNATFVKALDDGLRLLENGHPFLRDLNVIDTHTPRENDGSRLPNATVVFHGTSHATRNDPETLASYVKFFELKSSSRNTHHSRGQVMDHGFAFFSAVRQPKRRFMDVLLVVKEDKGPHVEFLRVFRCGKLWHHIVEPSYDKGATTNDGDDDDPFDPVYEFLAIYAVACPYAAHCMPRTPYGQTVSFPAPGSFGFVIKITKEIPGHVELPPWLVLHVRGRKRRLIDFYVKYIYRGEGEEKIINERGVLSLVPGKTAVELARKEADFQNRVHDRLMALDLEWKPAEHGGKTLFDEFAYVPRALRGDDEEVWTGMTLRELVGDFIGSIDLNQCVVTAGCGEPLCSLAKDSDFEERREREEEEEEAVKKEQNEQESLKTKRERKDDPQRKGKEDKAKGVMDEGSSDEEREDKRERSSRGTQEEETCPGSRSHQSPETAVVSAELVSGPVTPPARRGECLERVARTMALFHRLGMVHGDLRLPNLMWVWRRGAKQRPLVSILDFGAARNLEETFKYDLRLKYLSVAHLEVLMESDKITATAKDEAESLAHLAYVSRPLRKAAMLENSLSLHEKSLTDKKSIVMSIFDTWSTVELLPEYLPFYQNFERFVAEGNDLSDWYERRRVGDAAPYLGRGSGRRLPSLVLLLLNVFFCLCLHHCCVRRSA